MSLWLIIAYCIFALPTLYAGLKLNKKGTKIHAKGVLSALIAYSILFFAIWIFDLEIPDYIIFMPLISVFVSGFFGHYLGRFQKSKIFLNFYNSFNRSPFVSFHFVHCLFVYLFYFLYNKANL